MEKVFGERFRMSYTGKQEYVPRTVGMSFNAQSARDRCSSSSSVCTSGINRAQAPTSSSSSSSSSQPSSIGMCMAVNALHRKICVVSQEERDESRLLLLEPLPDGIFRLFGRRLADAEVDEELDDYIHCDQCDCFYSYSCLMHPLYRVLDRPDTGYAETPQRAQRTLPAFLYIGLSSIPDAGKGVFTKVDIPVGVVFGPYEGILRRDAKRAECDGYSWEIKRANVVVYVDGRDPRFSNWMRYINSSRHEAEQNLLAFQYAGGVYYRVFRPVDREKELLVWYGAAFGKALGINTTPTKLKRKPKATSGYRPFGNQKNPYVFG